jgi:hypothetical protein
MYSRFIAGGSVLVAICTIAAQAADWKAPKDGVFTEKQLTSYLEIRKNYTQSLNAAGKALQGNQAGAAALAVLTELETRRKADVAKHGLQEEEYQWMEGQATATYGALAVSDLLDQSRAAMADSIKKNQDELKEKQSSLAQYEKAAKDGRRVMAKDDREAAIKSAKEDQQSALDEAKQHADEAKAAREDADKADADAKQNDALAKNPPSDVSADDRAGYVEDKKNAAQTARDAAKEARDKQNEAIKAEKEARAKADAAGSRAKDPELPTTPEDKAQVKQQNEDMIKQLKADIDNTQQAIKLVQDSQQTGLKQWEAELAKIPAQNLALLKKHRTDWEQAWGMKK